MLRLTILLSCVCLALLTCGVASAADDIAKLKKLMPKDQLDIIERVQALNELRNKSYSEKNGLRKREMNDEYKQNVRKLQDNMSDKLKKEGLKDWVFFGKTGGMFSYTLFIPSTGDITVLYKGMNEESKKTVRNGENGDIVKVTIKPNGKLGKDLMYPNLSGQFDGSLVESIEKISNK